MEIINGWIKEYDGNEWIQMVNLKTLEIMDHGKSNRTGYRFSVMGECTEGEVYTLDRYKDRYLAVRAMKTLMGNNDNI